MARDKTLTQIGIGLTRGNAESWLGVAASPGLAEDRVNLQATIDMLERSQSVSVVDDGFGIHITKKP
jgi:hypothetical protein